MFLLQHGHQVPNLSILCSHPVDHGAGLAGLLAVEHPDVADGRGLVGEAAVAESAAVGLGAGVRHRVPLEHPARVELLPAVLAREHVRRRRLQACNSRGQFNGNLLNSWYDYLYKLTY